MFEKLAKPVQSSRPTKQLELPLTQAFVAVVQAEGFRLSYSALALAARIYKEDSSNQILGQRGATLVKSLPKSLHPTVCQKKGGYNKEVFAQFEDTPEDLRKRPVITEETVAEAIKEVAKKAKSKKSK